MDAQLSRKCKFYAFISMVFLVFVHGYNLHNRFLQPFTTVDEAMTLNAFLQYFLANGLLRFRIPMLFVISGFLFALGDAKPYRERIGKRARTLLAPYLLWSAAGLLLTLLLEQWALTRAAVVEASLWPFPEQRLLDYSLSEWLVRLLLAPLPFQLWFIRCLFVYNLMYPLLRKAVTRFPKLSFGVAGFLWLTEFHLWFLEGEGLLFFSLGIFLCKREIDLQTAPRRWALEALGYAWVGAAAVKTFLAFNGHLVGMPVQPLLLLLHKCVGLSGLVTVWYGFDRVVECFMARRWFVWPSAFSFIIYALHAPLVNYAMTFLFPYGEGVPHFRLLMFVGLPLAVIAICVGTGAALRRLAPGFYGLLTGGRGLVAADSTRRGMVEAAREEASRKSPVTLGVAEAAPEAARR